MSGSSRLRAQSSAGSKYKHPLIHDLKKSLGLLQAYGEYQRFVSISKKFMRANKLTIQKK